MLPSQFSVRNNDTLQKVTFRIKLLDCVRIFILFLYTWCDTKLGHSLFGVLTPTFMGVQRFFIICFCNHRIRTLTRNRKPAFLFEDPDNIHQWIRIWTTILDNEKNFKDRHILRNCAEVLSAVDPDHLSVIKVQCCGSALVSFGSGSTFFYHNSDPDSDPGSQPNADPYGSWSSPDFPSLKKLIFTWKIYSK